MRMRLWRLGRRRIFIGGWIFFSAGKGVGEEEWAAALDFGGWIKEMDMLRVLQDIGMGDECFLLGQELTG